MEPEIIIAIGLGVSLLLAHINQLVTIGKVARLENNVARQSETIAKLIDGQRELSNWLNKGRRNG